MLRMSVASLRRSGAVRWWPIAIDNCRARRDNAPPQSVATIWLLLLFLLMCPGNAPAVAQGRTTVTAGLEAGERIDFFTTAAHLSADGKTWNIPIHGRVFRPENSIVRKAIIARALKSGFGIEADRASQLLFDQRINLLLGDNKGNREITVQIAGRSIVLPRSGADGHFNGEISIPVADLAAATASGRLDFSAQMKTRDARTYSGTVLLVPRQGYSIISDIDDTVKITNVLDRKRMLEATFTKPFEAVPGLARLYQTWGSEGAALHFVSTCPWHLYEPIATFLQEAGFPAATIAMKKIRLTDRSVLDLFADATRIKPPEIEALLKAHPERTFVLIGDSGEKDPEIYADTLRRYPTRIARIFIRNVTGTTADDPRFVKVFAGIDRDRWQLFANPDELPRKLRE